MKKPPAIIVLAFVLPMQACFSARSHPPEHVQVSYRNGPYQLQRELSTIDTIDVGDYPKSVYLSPKNRVAYVCNLEQGSIDILRTSDGQRTKRIRFNRTPTEVFLHDKTVPSFEEKPVEVGFTDNGRYVWISLLNAGGVVVLDTTGKAPPTGTPVRVAKVLDKKGNPLETVRMRFIPTGLQPKIISSTPNGRLVFVANWKGHNVSVIDSKTFRKIKDIPVGALPRGICFTAASAFVANFGSHTISEIDLATLEKKHTLKEVGMNPRHMVLAADGRSLYVSNHGDAFIRQIDIAKREVIAKCHVGGEPRTIALSRNKNFLFVANYKDDTFSVLDLKNFAETITVNTIRRPIGISVDPRSDTVWVTGYWDKSVRRYKFDSVLEEMDAPATPFAKNSPQQPY